MFETVGFADGDDGVEIDDVEPGVFASDFGQFGSFGSRDRPLLGNTDWIN